MTAAPHLSGKLAQNFQENPWLGTVRSIEPFRPRWFLTGYIVIAVGLPILLKIFGDPQPTLVEYLIGESIYLFSVGLILWFAFRRRLVICDHGLLFGPTTVEERYSSLVYDDLDITSLTKIKRFWRFGTMNVQWLGNGSSLPWGTWGIAFRTLPVKAKDVRGHPLSATAPWADIYIFGTRTEPSEVVEKICRAMADHGLPEALYAPALREPPVPLSGRKKDLVRQLPQIFADQGFPDS